MSAVNAFNWQEYTDQEHAKNGDPFKNIKRNAVISANVTDGMNRVRDKKPTHGTILGITTKQISLKAPDMMPMKGGARMNSGRKLPQIDERRAIALFNEGLTKKEIAERFDIPYKSILTFFKKLGAQDSRGPYDWSGKYKKETI